MLAISPEGPSDGPAIEALLDRAFGPDRRRKTSYRYREGVAALPELALVARDRGGGGGALVGAIRYWPIRLGERPALLLGPLAIEPARQGQGIGRALAEASLARAEALGWRLVFLVGDPAYYARYGFAVVPAGIAMPGEDPGRLQYRTLAGASLPPGGGTLLRHRGGSGGSGVEPAEQRSPKRRHAFVAGHAGLHLADPVGHRPGDGGFARDLGQPPHERPDGEHDGAGFREPAQRLPLDPQPELLAGVRGR
jgi:predicted N-acetyltransferase YhbS